MTDLVDVAAPIAVDDLLAALSLPEKAALTTGGGTWCTAALPDRGIPAITMSDGPHGVRRRVPTDAATGAMRTVPATCFPPAVALGSSWDRGLLWRVGAALGREGRARDVQVLLGPGINIKRSPLCGRNFEYLSEDPHVAGVLGAALIDGIQSEGVAASLKHFAVNNQETDRHRVSAEVDERTLREIYLAGFEHAVRVARPWTVMCSYNRVNGVPAAQHRWLLTEVLRGEWGFDGLVVSDWGAVSDRAAALAAGLDVEMPGSGELGPAEVLAAVADGRVTEAQLDTAVRRILALAERTRRSAEVDAPSVEEHHRLAREVAGRCVVLLKNDDAVLPLVPGRSLAVVGELARNPRYQGAGSSAINPTRLDDALSELSALAGTELPFAPGYSADGASTDPVLVAHARAVAAAADVTVVFLGLPVVLESEGFDRTDIELPAAQLAVLDALAETGTKIVVVLSNGGVVQMSEWVEQADAVVEGWLLGQAGGGALADVLFGMVNPGGKLTETVPLCLEHTPAFLNFPGEPGHVRYGEGVFVGYRHYNTVDAPVSFPFGHGLSYTTFAYDDLQIDASGADEAFAVQVTVRVTNTGQRAGREVVQLYVAPQPGAVRRPAHELRGFAVVELEPGETQEVAFTLGQRDFAFYDVRRGRWSAEAGRAGIEVGASSRDIRLHGGVDVVSAAVASPIHRDSTLLEWAATAGGQALLRRLHDTGRVPRFLTGDGLRTLGGFPLAQLARYPVSGLDPDRLDDLVAEANRVT